MQTQGTTAKDSPRSEEPKAKKTKSVHADATELFKPAKKEDKQKKLKCRREYIKKPKETSATSNNAINASKKDLSKKCDTRKVKCVNYNKKGHYANNCTEPKN